jgi:hypothetical protein
MRRLQAFYPLAPCTQDTRLLDYRETILPHGTDPHGAMKASEKVEVPSAGELVRSRDSSKPVTSDDGSNLANEENGDG